MKAEQKAKEKLAKEEVTDITNLHISQKKSIPDTIKCEDFSPIVKIKHDINKKKKKK